MVEAGTLEARVEGVRGDDRGRAGPAAHLDGDHALGAEQPQLEAAIEGREQSVHLEHLMALDWERPLVPRKRELVRACACDRGGACEHVAALAYAFAEEIDRDPALLLRWRGCRRGRGGRAGAGRRRGRAVPAEAWEAGPLPEPRPLRPLPVGAVLKRLGPSGLRVGGRRSRRRARARLRRVR